MSASTRTRRLMTAAGAVLLVAIVVGFATATMRHAGDRPAATVPATTRPPAAKPAHDRDPPRPRALDGVLAPAAAGRGHLAPGSDPSVLPGPVLIADRTNNRLLLVDPRGQVLWRFPRAADLRADASFLVPDDAFFAPDGRSILATEEDNFVISRIAIASHHITWRYGAPGVAGSAPDRLWNPDDAMPLPGGGVFTADIKNCRLVAIAPGAHRPQRQLGITGWCVHRPPVSFASPNGAFPMHSGGWMITEINGDWVDGLTRAGRLAFAVHPPGVAYPSDANEVAPGRYLVTDYSSPGQLVMFDRAGRALWRYAPHAGPGELNHPSLALPLPNGDVLCNDDRNDRVIVIDPHSGRIVWQYGHTGARGSAPGYLDNPDGVDLAPPFSLLDRVAATAAAPH